MQGHHLTKSLTLVTLLTPATALPLTIGDIEINSGLNQPLNAEIPLTLSADEKPATLKVKMASASDFANNKIRWRHELSNIQVTRIGSTIKISSKTSMTDPTVDFLLEINTPQGPQFRHYKITLDNQASNNEIMTTSIETAKASEIAPESTIDQAPEPTISYQQRINANGEFGPIQKTDTLWQIANHLAKSHGVSNKKMLIGLRETNPNAFYNRSQGSLKAGAYLQIPDFKKPSKSETTTKPEPTKVVEHQVTAVEAPVITQAVTPTPAPTPAPTAPSIDSAQLQPRIEQLEQQVEQLQKEVSVLQSQPSSVANTPVTTETTTDTQAKPVSLTEPSSEQVVSENSKLNGLYLGLAGCLGISLINLFAWLRFKKSTATSRQSATEPAVKKSPNQPDKQFEIEVDNVELNAQENDLLADIDADLALGKSQAQEQPAPLNIIPDEDISEINPVRDNYRFNEPTVNNFEFDFDFEDSRRPAKKTKTFKSALDQARYEQTDNNTEK